MTFGFTITHPWTWNEQEQYVQDIDLWRVFLPHQCDTWDIAGENSREGVPHAKAVANLETFIAEAQDALTRLKNGIAEEGE